jgi:hypothetical protein
MNQASLIPIFKNWMPDAVIWDGASAHHANAMGEFSCFHIRLNSTHVNGFSNG